MPAHNRVIYKLQSAVSDNGHMTDRTPFDLLPARQWLEMPSAVIRVLPLHTLSVHERKECVAGRPAYATQNDFMAGRERGKDH